MKEALAISWNIIDKKSSLSILILPEFGAFKLFCGGLNCS
jgi:hypothetical protein